jgi:hypothetical protein
VAVQSISTSSSTSSGSSGPDIVVVAAPPAIDTEAAAAGASTAGCPSLLEQLIWPMTAAEFMRDCFRKKAVCTLFSEEAAAAAGHEARTEALAEALARLELLPMMHESASEQIFVWMKPSSSGGGAAAASTGTGIGTGTGGKRDERIASFGVQEPEAAKVCYDAGASLYFGCPAEMVEPWVGTLASDLGFNFGAGGAGGLQAKGEIEVFITRAGHLTGWHTDYQENFTVQLREQQIGGSGGSLEPPGPLLTRLHTVYMAYSECLPTRLNPLAERTCFSQVQLRGKKRWLLADSKLASPLRAFTPHYKGMLDVVAPFVERPHFCCLQTTKQSSDKQSNVQR